MLKKKANLNYQNSTLQINKASKSPVHATAAHRAPTHEEDHDDTNESLTNSRQKLNETIINQRPSRMNISEGRRAMDLIRSGNSGEKYSKKKIKVNIIKNGMMFEHSRDLQNHVLMRRKGAPPVIRNQNGRMYVHKKGKE